MDKSKKAFDDKRVDELEKSGDYEAFNIAESDIDESVEDRLPRDEDVRNREMSLKDEYGMQQMLEKNLKYSKPRE